MAAHALCPAGMPDYRARAGSTSRPNSSTVRTGSEARLTVNMSFVAPAAAAARSGSLAPGLKEGRRGADVSAAEAIVHEGAVGYRAGHAGGHGPGSRRIAGHAPPPPGRVRTDPPPRGRLAAQQLSEKGDA